MQSKPLLIVLGVLAICFLAAIEGMAEQSASQNQTTRADKQSKAKQKLQQAKTVELQSKLRVSRDVSKSMASASVDKISKNSLRKLKESNGDLMTAAHEKKYMLVKKKPKHKKIKMEVFKPKMKYKKIKMKIPVKKMKKKKVKGYLVKKEHGHHGH